ncbi:MAG TPA: GNAT family N-acetyltransferase [Candidatus Tumulicola sp.]
MADVRIAPANDANVRSFARRRSLDETAARLGIDLAERGTAFAAYDRSEAIGIVFAYPSAQERYVGDLFVESSYRGEGIGGRLLDAALEDAGDVARRVLMDPNEAAAVALALRRGLAPRGVLLEIAGSVPREDALLRMAAGDYRFAVDAVDPVAHRFALDALDAEVRGTTRAEEHARFAREADGLAVFLEGEFVAYAYVWPSGRIGPIATASAAYLTQIFAFAIVTLQRRFGASWCTALVPGEAVRLLRAVLKSGLRIERSMAIAADDPLPDPARYVGFHPMLL